MFRKNGVRAVAPVWRRDDGGPCTAGAVPINTLRAHAAVEVPWDEFAVVRERIGDAPPAAHR